MRELVSARKRAQIRAWAGLPTPHLPDPAPAGLGFVESPEPDMFMWVDPRRIVPNRAADDTFVDQTFYYVEEVLANQASPGV